MISLLWFPAGVFLGWLIWAPRRISEQRFLDQVMAYSKHQGQMINDLSPLARQAIDLLRQTAPHLEGDTAVGLKRWKKQVTDMHNRWTEIAERGVERGWKEITTI